MLAVLITLTPGSQNNLVDCPKAKVCITVVAIMNAKTRWSSTLDCLKHILFPGTHMQVAPKSKIHWLPATFHNSRGLNHCEVCHGSVEAIPVLDPVDVEEAYSHIASAHHSIQQHDRSHGLRHASFCQAEDSMAGRLVLRCEVSLTEGVQKLRWIDSNNGHDSHSCTYPWSVPAVAIA